MADDRPVIFNRSKVVGVSLPDEQVALAHGYLNDNIYTMSVKVAFDLTQGAISAIEGSMIRYTTYRCAKAEEVFGRAVGIPFNEGMDSAIKKTIGRVGCRHVAALLIDCCHAVPRTLVTREMEKGADSATAALAVAQKYPFLSYLLGVKG